MTPESPSPQPSAQASDAPSLQTASLATLDAKIRNLLITIVAVVLSVAIALGLQTKTTTVSLDALAERAVPLEVALGNGKPTLIEFYANWCTTCQAMAADMDSLEQNYHDRLNMVMLNVDNAKWLPELLSYRVDGIPHFVFLNPQGEAIASVIGEQPRTIMAANLDALIAGTALPHVQTAGQVSAFNAPIVPDGQDDPRSHGSQVVK